MNVQHIGQLPPKVSHDPTTDNLKGKRLDEFESAQHTKFSGKLLSDLIFVEVCAGSARLTRTARDFGFNGIAIDHTTQRSCGVDICIFELEDPLQVDELCNFLESEADNIAAVWIAPSCGTASKARERKLPQLAKLGIEVPIPLRSQEQPDQIDWRKPICFTPQWKKLHRPHVEHTFLLALRTQGTATTGAQRP